MTEVILHLSSGHGPQECEWAVFQLALALCSEGRSAGLACEPVEPITGPVARALLSVSGAEAEAFIADCIGTTRWVGTSPFRPLHKRRNWFVGVQRISTDKETPDLRDQRREIERGNAVRTYEGERFRRRPRMTERAALRLRGDELTIT